MKKKIPKKITLDSLEKSAIKYLEKYSATEYQLKKVLRRKIIKNSFFYKIDPKKDFDLIKLIIKKFKEIGLIDDKVFSENKVLTYIDKGYSKKKIIFNLKNKGISDENIQKAVDNLEKSFLNFELLSALIYAHKKKILAFKKKEKNFYENKKDDELVTSLRGVMSINMEMVQEGYAWEYDGNNKNKDLEELKDIRRVRGTLSER